MRACEAKISICNRWELEEFKTTCELVFNRFLEAFSLFLVFSVQTKPNKLTLNLNVSRSKQQQQQQAAISQKEIVFRFQKDVQFEKDWGLMSCA